MKNLIDKQVKLENRKNVVIGDANVRKEDWKKKVDRLLISNLGLGEKRKVNRQE